MKQVTVIGCGMGNPKQITEEGRLALEAAQCVIGSQRLLDVYADPQKPSHMAITYAQLQEVVRETDAEQIAVLVSGDTGFFSGAALYSHLEGAEVSFIPGISSLSAFCARLGLSWDHTRLCSLHGRECNLVQEIMHHEWVFAITGNNLVGIRNHLLDYRLGNLEIYVGENLSTAEERIYHGTVQNLAADTFGSLTVIMIHNPSHWTRTPASIPDAEFLRGNVPMTKQAVRTLVMGQLRMGTESIGWDIGAGTGSVSVEMALQARAGKVYAIEQNPEAIELLHRNRQRWYADSMEILQATAPEGLADLPAPDCVFLGGTKGNGEAVLRIALEKNPKVRVVATAVSMEGITAFRSMFERYFTNTEIMQVQVANMEQKGNAHLMMGQNPVWIFSGGGRSWQEF